MTFGTLGDAKVHSDRKIRTFAAIANTGPRTNLALRSALASDSTPAIFDTARAIRPTTLGTPIVRPMRTKSAASRVLAGAH